MNNKVDQLNIPVAGRFLILFYNTDDQIVFQMTHLNFSGRNGLDIAG